MPGGGVGSLKAGRGAENNARPARAGQNAPKPGLRAGLRGFDLTADAVLWPNFGHLTLVSMRATVSTK
jgi:hypothetical protein